MIAKTQLLEKTEPEPEPENSGMENRLLDSTLPTEIVQCK